MLEDRDVKFRCFLCLIVKPKTGGDLLYDRHGNSFRGRGQRIILLDNRRWRAWAENERPNRPLADEEIRRDAEPGGRLTRSVSLTIPAERLRCCGFRRGRRRAGLRARG